MYHRPRSSIDPFLTSLSFPEPPLDFLDDFHEATKINDETIRMDGLWIGSYLSDPHAILETANNHKRFFLTEAIKLPNPEPLDFRLGEALRGRATTPRFAGEEWSLQAVSNLLHPAIAATRASLVDQERDLKLHKRPYASGGGLYPIEIYPILLKVNGHGVMVTHYDAVRHRLQIISRCDDASQILAPLSDAEGRLEGAALIIVMTCAFARTTVKYGARGYRFALIEAGEIAQNLSLCAQSAGGGTLPWGGYYDDDTAELLQINGVDEAVVHCMAVGQPA